MSTHFLENSRANFEHVDNIMHVDIAKDTFLVNINRDNIFHFSPAIMQLDWTPSRYTQKHDSRKKNQKGYGSSETTYRKLSARILQMCFNYFFVTHFHLFSK